MLGILVFVILITRKRLRLLELPAVTNDGDAMASLLIRASGRIAWVLIALMIAATSARAEQPYSFAATPGKLPKTVVPIHYAIDLKPDLEKLTLAGSELGDIEVTATTGRLVMNADHMTGADDPAVE